MWMPDNESLNSCRTYWRNFSPWLILTQLWLMLGDFFFHPHMLIVFLTPPTLQRVPSLNLLTIAAISSLQYLIFPPPVQPSLGTPCLVLPLFIPWVYWWDNWKQRFFIEQMLRPVRWKALLKALLIDLCSPHVYTHIHTHFCANDT